MRFLIVYFLLTVTVVWAEYPSNLPKCSNNDVDCLMKAGQEFVDKYHTGNVDVNLLPFDPLHVKSMVLDRNPSSPVNIEFKFSDLDLIGLKNMKLLNFKGFTTDLSGRNEFDAMVPELDLKGKYNIDGRVLVLPIVGNGNCEIKCKNLTFKYAFDLKRVEKNGKIYAALTHVKLEINPDLVQFNFQNLFNGDKALGDNMNKFINENWKDIFEEIKPNFSKALSLVVKSMLNKFFEKTPYADLFI